MVNVLRCMEFIVEGMVSVLGVMEINLVVGMVYILWCMEVKIGVGSVLWCMEVNISVVGVDCWEIMIIVRVMAVIMVVMVVIMVVIVVVMTTEMNVVARISIIRDQDTAIVVTGKFGFVWVNLMNRGMESLTINLHDGFVTVNGCSSNFRVDVGWKFRGMDMATGLIECESMGA